MAKSTGPSALKGFEEGLGIREGRADVLFGSIVETEQQEMTRLGREVGLPQLIVDNAVAKSLFETGEINAGLEAGLNILRPIGQAQELEADLAQNQARGSYWTAFLEEGGTRIQLDADLAELGSKLANAGLEEEQIERYREVVNGIDQSTPLGRAVAQVLAFSPQDPTTASFIGQAFLQQSAEDFRLMLSRLQAENPDPIEQAKFTATVMSGLQDTVDKLAEYEEAGASDDLLGIYRDMLDVQANEAQRLMDAGVIPAFNLPRAVPGRGVFGGVNESAVEFVEQQTPLQSVQDVVEAVGANAASIEEIERIKRTYFSTNEELAQWDSFVALVGEREAAQQKVRDESALDFSSPENMENMRRRLIQITSDTTIDPARKAAEMDLIFSTFEAIDKIQAMSQFTHRPQSRNVHTGNRNPG
jgi:hypothetical protein